MSENHLGYRKQRQFNLNTVILTAALAFFGGVAKIGFIKLDEMHTALAAQTTGQAVIVNRLDAIDAVLKQVAYQRDLDRISKEVDELRSRAGKLNNPQP